MENMYYQCLRVGSVRCLPVFYEQLVLHPEPMLHNILTFLELPWHSAVLHHEDQINKPGGISLSRQVELIVFYFPLIFAKRLN